MEGADREEVLIGIGTKGRIMKRRTMKPLASFRRAVGVPPGNETGSILIIAASLAGILLVVTLSVYQIASQDAGLAQRDFSRVQALYLAESGLAKGLTWLEAQEAPPTDQHTFYPWGQAPDTLSCGTYTMAIRPDPGNGATAAQQVYTIASMGVRDGHQRSLELDVATGTIADFLYFTNREHEPGAGATVWYCSADVIDGPLHSNDQISIFGDPIFMDKVTSAYGGPADPGNDPTFQYYNGSPHAHIESSAESNPPHDEPTFMEGYELGVMEIPFPSHAVLADLKDMARDGGISISGNYEFVFSRPDDDGDPMYGYVSYMKGKNWTDIDLSTINGTIYVNGGFSVSGTLDGVVTLISSGPIEITNDVIYRDSSGGIPSEGCDDLLGLVAGTDITVANNEPNQDDCVIHAAMIAINNTFRVANWNTGSPRGALTVWGSIIQDFRGSVGTGYWDGDEMVILTGYEKDYHYDQRLRDITPPSFIEFFQTGKYVRLAWREV
jgi:hypothetical protein